MSKQDSNLNDGFVPSVWTCEEDILNDIIEYSYYHPKDTEERPPMPDTLKEYYANEKSAKELKYNDSEKDIDESTDCKESVYTGPRKGHIQTSQSVRGNYKRQSKFSAQSSLYASFVSADHSNTSVYGRVNSSQYKHSANTRRYTVDLKPSGYKRL
ncbi:uncharacterized protein LOC123006284 [Tribolium madens]|uniref:uncharacterized protein LOC123006284 n=1 Tax=Tribolium madens TaxID=41895 RepID=UPI001CF75CDD|nr:uncharacterized protein LOC123006284 [Tribolium madens]XP_044256593.1 uncharacterized protein LOC123006284 [Tribolium madens]XP_044256594.1 uncharacterized protein LOC123006284 [Tribolium madens]